MRATSMRRLHVFLLLLLSAVIPAGADAPPLGDFQCYELKPQAFEPVPVTVEDRFGTLVYPARFPHRLCAPANDEGDPGLDHHLMGYTVDVTGRTIPGQRLVTRFGSITVDLIRPDLLLVPTAIDHDGLPAASPRGTSMQCYHVEPSAGSPKFVTIAGVEVTDGLETVLVDLLEPDRLCVPATVDGEHPSDEEVTGDLVCYATRSESSFGDVRVLTRNLFGTDEARLIHRRDLCVPAPPVTNPTTSSSSTSTTTSTTSTLATTSTTSTTSTSSTTVSTSTTIAGRCGDGRVDPGEECDDGNQTAGDCCSPTCTVEPDGTRCGDDDPCNGDERCRAGRCQTTPPCRSDVVLAAITNFRSSTVSLVDPVGGQVEANVAAGAGAWGVAFHPAGTEIWITNRHAKSVSVIDVATRSVSATIPVGRTPLGVALDSSGARAYVASYGGNRIDVIDTASRTRVAGFPVDRGPSGVAFDASRDMLWVTSFGSDTVLAVDPASGAIRTRVRVARKPTQLAIDSAQGRLYVSNFGAGIVTVIDLEHHTVVATIRVGRKPFGVAVDPARGRAYVTNAGQDLVTVVDTATDTVVARRHVAAGPLGVAVDPSGRILVTSGTGGVLSFLDPSGPASSALVVGTLPVAFGSFVGRVGVRCPDAPPCGETAGGVAGPTPLGALLDAAAASVRQASPGSIPDAALAQAVTDAIRRSEGYLAQGDTPALGRELRGILGTLRRGMAAGGLDRTTGSQLLDLVKRARALVKRSGH
jgi:YVTN family beta-propeller protein/cysteine-rich repeat protein